MDLTARLMADGKNVFGTLKVNNMMVADFVSAHGAAYPVLTSTASTSADGREIYLIVFNKSASDSTTAAIHLTSFSAARTQYWEVNGPSLTATSGVSTAEQGASLPLRNASVATHVFPAHSMTAIEFSRTR